MPGRENRPGTFPREPPPWDTIPGWLRQAQKDNYENRFRPCVAWNGDAVLTFLSRRLVASLIVLLFASYLVYILSANAGDPLESLRGSLAKNRAELMQQRVEELHLDVPSYLRYFIWLGGILKVFTGHFTLGQTLTGDSVTHQLGQAMLVTIQLLIASSLLAIIFGILIGITTALRQYSGYDYTVTFLSFLFFSLPSFFVAVILKAYVGIKFNNYLADPHVAWWAWILIPLLSGGLWAGVIGGNARRRWLTFGIGAVATFAAVAYVALTDWFVTPTIGYFDIIPVTIISVALALLVVVLTTGLGNKKALYSALTAVAVGIVAYFPVMYFSDSFGIWTVIGLGVLSALVGVVIGWLFGGYDRWASARTAGIAAFLMAVVELINRFQWSWHIYVADVVNGRPIATVGSATPDLNSISASFWIHGLDTFTHLLLPTISLCLISLASYSRYARANLLDVMNSDYIRTARAKGLPERTVVMRHAFRNALIPLTTIVAFDFGGLLGGAIITETVFSWSGMGNLFNVALKAVDVNPLMGFFLVVGIAAIVFNFLADLVYSALDPRIRVSA